MSVCTKIKHMVCIGRRSDQANDSMDMLFSSSLKGVQRGGTLWSSCMSRFPKHKHKEDKRKTKGRQSLR